MVKKTIEYKGFEIEYLSIRNTDDIPATKIGLAFHGYGKSAEDFQLIREILQPSEVIYSFNLLHHGNSTSPEHRLWKKSLQPLEFKAMFSHILNILNIDQFSLIGYSMGGRIALKLVEYFPAKVTKITLFAPDGLGPKLMYRFVTRTWLGRQLFQGYINYPGPLFFILRKLVQLKLVNPSVEKITIQTTGTLELRRQVGNTWFMYSSLYINQEKLQSIINEHHIPTLLIFGKYDKLVPPPQGRKFISGIEDGQLLVLKTGHQLMRKDIMSSPEITNHLSQ